jgi:hypothetical protein
MLAEKQNPIQWRQLQRCRMQLLLDATTEKPKTVSLYFVLPQRARDDLLGRVLGLFSPLREVVVVKLVQHLRGET